MKYKGYSVYDNEDFFSKYIEKRAKGNSPNDTIEKPIIEQLIGDVRGKHILDLGCGDGLYGKELLDKGAVFYDGIEGSDNMIKLAKQNLEGYPFTIKQQDIAQLKSLPQKYDIVLSRLVLHYIEDLESVLKVINSSLKEGGYFVFSIEHPVITSCYDAYHQQVKRGNWIVDNYFKSGERVNKWIEKDVVKYHRTIEEYWQLFKKTNFEIEELRESKPVIENFKEKTDYERRRRIPLFMLFKLTKKKL